MYFADYHTHSEYSYDGCEKITDMCEQAIRMGLSEIAITDHVDIYRGLPFGQLKDFDVAQDEPPYLFGTEQDPMFGGPAQPGGKEIFSSPGDLCGERESMPLQKAEKLENGHYLVPVPGGRMEMPFGRLTQIRLQDLYGEIARACIKYAGRLKVLAGAELGQPHVNPEEAEKFLEACPLDFVIGSVHNMDWDLDVYYYDFSDLDLEALYDAYLDQLLAMAGTGCFDVMGHLTYPLRYLYERRQVRLDLKPWYDRFHELFRILEYDGKGIELNVSGLSRDFARTMPPMEILKMYRECHGEIITIGSDAHTLDHIGDAQEIAQEMLRAAGFRYLTVFTARKPSFIKL